MANEPGETAAATTASHGEAEAAAMAAAAVTGHCQAAAATEAAAGTQAAHCHANLDLSSTARTFTAPQMTAPVDINVAGATRSVSAGDALTAAELLAVTQVMTSGNQALMLGALGNAVGGTFSLPSTISQMIGNLVVPAGVTAVHDFGSNPALNIAGTLTNAGSLYALSSNAAVNTATISASSVLNQQGALLTSVLPAGGLPGFTSAINSLNLHLFALNDIINQGVISSSGNLALNAGGAIVNQATMTAANNVSLMSAIGSITNSGVIAATAGNINIISQTAQNLLINNMNGILQALNGAINVRDASFMEQANLSISGGDMIARELNLYSGRGIIEANLRELSGTLSTYGYEARVYADTDNLTLGTIQLSGDPTYYNTGAITITGNVTVSEKLAILAGGDITSTAGLTQITAQNGGQGFDIHIVAGAELSPVCGSCSSDASSGSESTTSVDLNFASPGGGNIDFSASPLLQINASSTGGNNDGGSVTLAAFANGATGGQIILPAGSVINVSGHNSGANGNVTLIAGAQSGTGIQTGQVIASGGTGGGGTVTITTAQPVSSNAGTITFATDGSISTGNSLLAGATIEPAAVAIGNSISGNAISVTAGSAISNTAVTGTIAGTTVTAQSTGGAITVNADITGTTSVALQADGNLTTTGTARVISAAGSVSLTSDSGSIGTGTSDRLRTTAGTLLLSAQASGQSAYIDELNGVTLGTSAVAQDLDLAAAGTIDVNAAGNVSAGNSMKLSATAGNITTTSGRLISSGGAIDLSTTEGHIGTGTSARVLVDAGTLLAAAGGANSDVFIGELDSASLGTSSATRDFNLSAGTGIDIDAASDVAGPNSVSLAVTGSGDITRTAGSLVSSAGLVSLTTTAGSIGTGTSARVQTHTANLVANAAGGSVFVEELNAVNLGAGSSSASATFDLLASGNISNTASTGTVSAADVVLRAQAGGTLTLNANVTGTNSINARSVGLMSTTGSARFVSTAGTVTLQSDGSGVGTSGSRVKTDAANLVVNAPTARVFIDELDEVSLGSGASSASIEIDILAGGTITNSATVSSQFTTLRSTGGSITLNANVTGSTSVSIRAAGDITTPGSGRLLTNAAGTVTLTSDNGSIGTGTGAGQRVLTTAGNLVANAAAQSVFISELDGVNLGAGSSNAGATFDLIAAGNISNTATTGTVSATDIVIRTTSGTITVNSNIAGTGSVDLRASGNLVPGAGRVISAAGTVTLTSDTGSIGSGTGAGQRFLIDAGTLLASAAGTTQNIFLDELNSVSLSTSSATGVFDLAAGTGIDINAAGDVSGVASITLAVSGSGDITRTAGSLLSSAGTVTLSTNDGHIGEGTSDRIVVDAGALVVTAGGTGRNAFLQEVDSVSLGTSSATAAFDLTAGSGIDINAAGNVGSTGSVTLAVSAAGDITRTAGSLLSSTGTVALSTNDGHIGEGSSDRIVVDAGTLTAAASGTSKDVFIAESNAVSIGTSSATGNFNLTAGTGIDINAAGDVAGVTSIALAVSGPGNITRSAGRLVSSAGTVDLNTANGNIGSGTSDRIQTDTANLVANASGGSVFVDELNGLTLGAGSSSASNTFDVLATGAISNAATTGTVSAADIVLRSSGGTVTANSDITGSTSVEIRASGSVSTTTGRIISGAGSVTLTSDNAGIGTGTSDRVKTDAGTISLSAATGQSAFIDELDSVTIDTSSVGQDIDLTAGGSIDIDASGGVSAGNAIKLTAAAGSITTTSGRLSSAAGTVDLATTDGHIGTGTSARVLVEAAVLIASAGGTARDVYIDELDAVSLGSSSATRDFDLTAGSSIDINASGDISGTASITLAVSGAGDITRSAGSLLSSAGTVSLSTTNGHIGGGTSDRIVVDAGTLLATASGTSKNVFIQEAGSVSLGTSSASAGFDLIAAGGIDINAAGNVSGSASTILAVSGSGDITRTAGSLISSAGTVTLSTNAGHIGEGTSDRVVVDAGTLTATAGGTNRNAFLHELSSVSLGTSSATAIFDITSAGGIDVNATGHVTGTTSLSLTVTGTGNITRTDGRLVSSAGSVILDTGDGSIGTGISSRVHTEATNLIANATGGSVFIQELDGVNLGSGSSSASATFDLLATGAITNTATTGTVSASDIVLRSTGSAVTLSADLSGSTSVEVRAAGNIGAGTGRIISNSGSVTLTSDSGSIGTGGGAGQRVLIDAANLVANATASGQSVFLSELNGVNFGSSSSSANAIFDLVAAGAISNTATTGTVSGANIVLRSTGATITPGADITGTASVTLQANGSIIEGAGRAVSAAGTVTLISDTGGIGSGTGSGQRVLVTASNLIVEAATSGQSAFIRELDGVTAGAASVGAVFDLLAGGSISTAGSLGAGAIVLAASAGSGGAVSVDSALTAASSVSLTADGSGTVSISASGSIDVTGGTVTLVGSDVALAGPITAGGSGVVALRPNSALAIGFAGSGSAFSMDTTELGLITAVTLEVGDRNLGGNITLLGDYDVSGTGPGKYNLTFLNAGSYSGGTNTLILGDKTLTIDVGGTVQTGNLISDAPTMTITSTGTLTVDGSITLTQPGALLTLTSDGDIVHASGLLSAESIALDSNTGGIGTDAAPILVNGTNLTVTAAAGGSAFVSAQGSINLGPGSSTAGNTFKLTAAGTITNTAATGTVTATDVILIANGGAITLHADVSGTDSVSLQSVGNITTDPTASIESAAGTVSLSSSSGSIGTGTGDRLNIDAGVLVAAANGPGQSIFINEFDGVQLGNATSGVQAAVFNLAAATGDDGDVVLFNNVSAPTSLTINVGSGANSGNLLQSAGSTGRLASALVSLSANGATGVGEAGNPLLTSAGNLTANASGSGSSVVLSELDGINLGAGPSSADATFFVIAGGTISNTAGTGTVTADSIALTSTAGQIVVNANLTGTTEVNLHAAGQITTPGAARVVSSLGTVILLSDAGSIGVGGNPGERLRTDAGNLVANAAAPGQNVFIGELDDVNLGPASSSAGDRFDLVAMGSISNTTGTGTVTGQHVRLEAVGGAVTANADVIALSPTSLEVIADGNITTPESGRFKSDTGSITLISNNGSIGTGPGDRVKVDATNLVARALAAGQTVFIDELDDVNLGADFSGAATTFDLLAGGSISNTAVTGTLTADVIVLESGGGIGVNATITGTTSATLTATDGITTSGGARIVSSGGLVSLTSVSGSIGLDPGPGRVLVTALNLQANAPALGHNVFIQELDGVNLGPGGSGAGAVFDLVTPGPLTSSADLSAGQVSLRSTGSSIDLEGDIAGEAGVLIVAATSVSSEGTITAQAPDGAGAHAEIRALAGSLDLADVFTDAEGLGLVAGNITLSATAGITAGDLSASGSGGAGGGVVTLMSLGQLISVRTIAAGGSAAGGSVKTTSADLMVTGSNDGASVNVSSTGGVAGTIQLTTGSLNPFTVGDASVNGTAGNLLANGVSGGRIDLENRGGQVVDAGRAVQAIGTTGEGGKIVFEAPGSSLLTVVNNGDVRATNNADTSGIVGFNAGNGGSVDLSGTGSVLGGEFVGFGNLNPLTLEVLPTSGGTFTFSQTFIGNEIRISPIPGQEGVIILEAIGVRPDFDGTQNQNNNAQLDSEIGTRIPTDVTSIKPPGTHEDSLLHGSAEFNVGKEDTLGGLIPGAAVTDDTFGQALINNLQQAGIVAGKGSGKNYFNLDKGNVLFAPQNGPIVVGTHEGEVHIQPGAAVFIMETGNDVAIYDLHDSHSGSVKIVAGKKLITLSPGRQVVLTRVEKPEFDGVNPGRKVAYRKAKRQDLAEGIRAFGSDFSIPSALMSIAPLKQLLTSNKPEDRKLARKLLKNAVLLTEFTGARGAYKTATQ